LEKGGGGERVDPGQDQSGHRAGQVDPSDDGLPGFSANDWAAPAMTYLFLSGYADMRPPLLDGRYRQFRILATLGALAVNVITI
jgi:hypothetical protein